MLRTSRRHDPSQRETANSRYLSLSTPKPTKAENADDIFSSAFGAQLGLDFITLGPISAGGSYRPLYTASAPVTPYSDEKSTPESMGRVRNSPRPSFNTISIVAQPPRRPTTRVRSLSTPFLQPLSLPAPLSLDDALDDSEDSTQEDLSTDTIRPTTSDSTRTRRRFGSTPEKLRNDIVLPVETESALDTECTSEESSYESAEEGASPVIGRSGNQQRRSQDGFEGFLSLPGSRPNSLTSAFDVLNLSPPTRLADPLPIISGSSSQKSNDRDESDITFKTFLESTWGPNDSPTLSSETGENRHTRTMSMSRDAKRKGGEFRNPSSFALAHNADGISPTQSTFPTNVQSPLAGERRTSRPFTDPWAISTATLPFPKSNSLPHVDVPDWRPETPRERLRSSTSTIHSPPPNSARASTPPRSRPSSLSVTPTLVLPDPASFARTPGPTRRPSEIPLARRRISSFFGLGLPKELLIAEAPRMAVIRRSTFPLAHITPSPIVAGTWKSTLDLVEYERLLAKHGAGEMKRQEVIYELCETERTFVASMGSVVKVFALPMRTSSGSWSVGAPTNFRRLFDWLDDIIMVHQQISLALTNQRNVGPLVEKFADSFLPLVKRLAVHQPYLVQFERIVKEIEVTTKDLSSEFGKFLRARSSAPECGGLSLSSFLLKPVQRLCKYPLFFKQLCDLTPSSHVDHLPTLRLLHSTDLIIRATQKVKIEEDNYDIAKNVVSRITGLPEGYQLAHRDRQLIAHGGLVQVHISESHQELLRRDSTPPSRDSLSDSDSSTNSVTTMTRSSTDSSSEFDLPGTPGSISREKRNIRSLSSSSYGSANPSTRFAPESLKDYPRRVVKTKAKETALHLFVFSDLIVLTTPSSRRSSKSSIAEDKIVYKVVELAKLVQITDLSGKTEHDHLIELDLTLYPNFTKRKTIFLSLPPTAPSVPGTIPSTLSIFKERSRWLQSFERSSRGSPRSRPSSANSNKQESRKRSAGLIDAKAGEKPDIDEREWWATRLSVVLTELEVSGPELEKVITLPGKRVSTGSRRESGEVKQPRVLRSTRSSRSLSGGFIKAVS